MLFAASAAGGALVAGVKFLDQPPPSPDTVLFARGLGFAFLFVFGVRVAAVFMLVASTIGLRTGFLPRWLVFGGYACGLVFLVSVTYVELLALLLPAWVTAVSVVMLRSARRSAEAARLHPDEARAGSGTRNPASSCAVDHLLARRGAELPVDASPMRLDRVRREPELARRV